jgi:proteasome lid subunit RPN8/RPN11
LVNVYIQVFFGIDALCIGFRLVFGLGLKCGASAIIVAHNHPTGNLQPSEADRQIARRIKEVGVLLQINALDFLIITSNNGYYSFADNSEYAHGGMMADGGVFDDEGNLIEIEVGDEVVEYRKRFPNAEEKTQIGSSGRVIKIVDNMAKVSFPNDNDYEEWIALKHLKKMAKGGYMADGGDLFGDMEGVDLFEDYEDQPQEVQRILSKYEIEDNNYDVLQNLKAELEAIGYTMDFGLDAEPYDLRKIGQVGKSEFMAKGGMMARGGQTRPNINGEANVTDIVAPKNYRGPDGDMGIALIIRLDYGHFANEVNLTEDKKMMYEKFRQDKETLRQFDMQFKSYSSDREGPYIEIIKIDGNYATMKALNKYVNVFNVKNKYKLAQGGITEHGLRVGDTIVSEIDANTIVVDNAMSGRRTINISTGQSMAKGGMSDKIVILVKDKKGNVVLKTTSTNKAADYCGLHGRENFTVETLDGRRIMAKGGRMGFKALSEKVASHYAGKSVPAKYQSEYGKFYDADEAKTVGNKVAAKVYRLQQGK